MLKKYYKTIHEAMILKNNKSVSNKFSGFLRK
jgi:hypothetical protein